MSRLLIPWTTTEKRQRTIPLPKEILFDIDLNALFYGDGTTRGGVRVAAEQIAAVLNSIVGNLPVFSDTQGTLRDSGKPLDLLISLDQATFA